MKIIFQISFCFLISVGGFSQEKKDSAKTNNNAEYKKMVLSVQGGVNITSMHSSDINYIDGKWGINEFVGISGIYTIEQRSNISLGIFYHHFIYYPGGNSLPSSYTFDFKMLLIPFRYSFGTNEGKKKYLRGVVGIEPGIDLTMDGIEYNSNGSVYKRENLGLRGFPLFISAGLIYYYSITDKVSIFLDGNYDKQFIPFTGSHKDTFSVSFFAFDLGLKFRFIKK